MFLSTILLSAGQFRFSFGIENPIRFEDGGTGVCNKNNMCLSLLKRETAPISFLEREPTDSFYCAHAHTPVINDTLSLVAKKARLKELVLITALL